jgi:ferredoxin-NADP reductase/Na+-translocating ferredoxin:NAD+ oxidoreductase RnfD subunit
MLTTLKALINKVTMYRLVAYGLGVLFGCSLVLSSLDILPFTPLNLATSAAVLCGSAFLTSILLSKLYKVPANSESVLITSLILVFVLNPARELHQLAGLAAAGVLAVSLKYLVSWQGKQIFNPAVLAIIVVVSLEIGRATWWVGSASLAPLTLVLGLLIVAKVRRSDMVITFSIAAAFLLVATSMREGTDTLQVMSEALLSGPWLFLAGVMLTEPLSTPPQKTERAIYAFLVAVLMHTRWEVGILENSPAAALLIGNLYSFAVSSRQRVELKLKEVVKMAPQVWDFIFTSREPVRFTAGQYAEWTLALPGDTHDSKGNRRTFTIASSPHERNVHLGVKFYQPTSAFKQSLQQLQVGDTVYLSNVSGSFCHSPQRGSFLFAAGGIGVTPFRSMLAEMVEQNQGITGTLLYAAASYEEVVYRDMLKLAQAKGLRVVLVLGKLEGLPEGEWEVREGFVTQALLQEELGKLEKPHLYVSGPPVFVDTLVASSKALKLPKNRIHTDYFPGY